MKISWNVLGEIVDLSAVSPERAASVLVSRGLEVEGIKNLSSGLEKVVTAKILKVTKHPQADRLNVCFTSNGNDEPVDIVCGASNVFEGAIVARSMIGARLPNGLEIKKSTIRGIVSNGMLCSASELGLSKESEGIIIFPDSTPLDQPVSKVLGRDDLILELNVTSNRGDCLSHLGIARELRAAFGLALNPHFTKIESPPLPKSKISLELNCGESCPQFFGLEMKGVKVGPSPDWVKRRLEDLGMRAINNIVDASNLVMLELGHPLHVYDLDRVSGSKIEARLSTPGEKLRLLDQSEMSCAGGEIVIADASGAIGLAGVMGGESTEVRAESTHIFLEAAEFDSRSVRSTAARFGKKSEASHRFERGIDPKGLELALNRLAQYISVWGGGEIVGESRAQLSSRRNFKIFEKRVNLPDGFIQNHLGATVSQSSVIESLNKLGFEKLDENGNEFGVPSYRHDVGLPHDLSEEVARSIGYDKIPSILPRLSVEPSPISSRWQMLERVKDSMVSSGFLECVSLPFLKPEILKLWSLGDGVPIENPLNSERSQLASTLLPGLVDSVKETERHHFGASALPIRHFEVRPVFHRDINSETGVKESMHLAFVCGGPVQRLRFANELRVMDFFDAKSVVENLFAVFRADFSPRRIPTERYVFLHPGLSMEIDFRRELIGWCGQLHPHFLESYGLKNPLWVCEIDLENLLTQSLKAMSYKKFKRLPEHPTVERDFAVNVPDGIEAGELVKVAVKAGGAIVRSIKVFDLYKGPQIPAGMTSLTLRVTFIADGRSLIEREIEDSSHQIVSAWKTKFQAELRK